MKKLTGCLLIGNGGRETVENGKKFQVGTRVVMCLTLHSQIQKCFTHCNAAL